MMFLSFLFLFLFFISSTTASVFPHDIDRIYQIASKALQESASPLDWQSSMDLMNEVYSKSYLISSISQDEKSIKCNCDKVSSYLNQYQELNENFHDYYLTLLTNEQCNCNINFSENQIEKQMSFNELSLKSKDFSVFLTGILLNYHDNHQNIQQDTDKLNKIIKKLKSFLLQNSKDGKITLTPSNSKHLDQIFAVFQLLKPYPNFAGLKEEFLKVFTSKLQDFPHLYGLYFSQLVQLNDGELIKFNIDTSKTSSSGLASTGLTSNYHDSSSNFIDNLKIFLAVTIKLDNDVTKLNNALKSINLLKNYNNLNKNFYYLKNSFDFSDSIQNLLFKITCIYNLNYKLSNFKIVSIKNLLSKKNLLENYSEVLSTSTDSFVQYDKDENISLNFSIFNKENSNKFSQLKDEYINYNEIDFTPGRYSIDLELVLDDSNEVDLDVGQEKVPKIYKHTLNFSVLSEVSLSKVTIGSNKVKNLNSMKWIETKNAITPSSISASSTPSLSLKEDNYFSVKFQVVPESTRKPHLVFVKLTNLDNNKISTNLLALTSSKEKTFDYNLVTYIGDLAQKLNYKSGLYSVEVFIQDQIVKGIKDYKKNKNSYVISLEFSEKPKEIFPIYKKSLLHESDTSLTKLKEIDHIMRPPAKRASNFMSSIFVTATFACLFVFFGLIVFINNYFNKKTSSSSAYLINFSNSIFKILYFFSFVFLLVFLLFYWLSLFEISWYSMLKLFTLLFIFFFLFSRFNFVSKNEQNLKTKND